MMACMVGYVYRIEDTLGLDIHYIGSTCKSIHERFVDHQYKYYDWIKNKENKKVDNISIYPYFKEYGIENFKVELLGEYDINDKTELRKLEQDKIEDNGYCVNKNRAYSSFDDKKEKHKEYRENNKDKIKEQTKIYRENNKDEINKIIVCECGNNYQKKNKYRHLKTKKHLSYLEKL